MHCTWILIHSIKMLHIASYAQSLRQKYQNALFSKLPTLEIESYVTYDPNNLFVYCPIDPSIAWTCRNLMREEKFRIRYNIYNNIQAGKNKLIRSEYICYPWLLYLQFG